VVILITQQKDLRKDISIGLIINMASYAGYMNGEEAYSLRCIVLHNGELSTTQYRSQSPKSTIVLDKFMLKSDGLHLIRLESNTVNGVLQPNLVVINTKKYCSDLIESVKTWQTGSGKKLGEYDDTFRIGTGQSTIMDGAVSIG
jgi:hypothetical protein